MRESKIRKLVKLVEQSNIDELEVTSWGRKVRITKRLFHQDNPTSTVAPEKNATTSQDAFAPVVEKTPEIVVEKLEEKGMPSHWVSIKSPMVGTFYRAPAPDAKPYVELNQLITAGQVVCIIEAMKLMNEIESELAGRVAKILVENGKPVEFGQTMFLIEPS
jgi:acetyl-CoA carboxylase biotin carboxyl carrier protein